MSVFAFGDSHTFGHDLSDCDGSKPSDKTYAALIAKELGTQYFCYAMGSYSNHAVSRRIIEHINEITPNDVVLVMWSYTIRREFLFDGNIGYRSISPNNWDHEFSQIFYKYIDPTHHYHITDSLKEIYIAQQLLKHHQIPFVFMSAVTDLSRALQLQDVHNSLINYIDIRDWLLLDRGFGFHDWAKEVLKLEFSGLHPGESAHVELSKLISKKINVK